MYHEWKLKLNISLFRRLREDIDEGDKLTLIHFSIPALLTFLTEDDKGTWDQNMYQEKKNYLW